jgi:hypothetical protein
MSSSRRVQFALPDLPPTPPLGSVSSSPDVKMGVAALYHYTPGTCGICDSMKSKPPPCVKHRKKVAMDSASALLRLTNGRLQDLIAAAAAKKEATTTTTTTTSVPMEVETKSQVPILPSAPSLPPPLPSSVPRGPRRRSQDPDPTPPLHSEELVFLRSNSSLAWNSASNQVIAYSYNAPDLAIAFFAVVKPKSLAKDRYDRYAVLLDRIGFDEKTNTASGRVVSWCKRKSFPGGPGLRVKICNRDVFDPENMYMNRGKKENNSGKSSDDRLVLKNWTSEDWFHCFRRVVELCGIYLKDD